MLACYGTEALGSHPAIGKEESEILMVLYFFQSDIRADIYVVFFIGKTDKTQQFSRTLDLQRLTGLINLPLWEE